MLTKVALENQAIATIRRKLHGAVPMAHLTGPEKFRGGLTQ